LSEIETKFIIGIVEELYYTYPKIRLLTVHDSIYYPESYEEQD
jgi:hypothetical protein